MKFYSDAAASIQIAIKNVTNMELSPGVKETLEWLKVQQRAWDDLASRMREKGCSVPKMLSEDMKRAKINEFVVLIEDGELQGGIEGLIALAAATPSNPKFRAKYKYSEVNSFEDVDALSRARMRPAKVEIR